MLFPPHAQQLLHKTKGTAHKNLHLEHFFLRSSLIVFSFHTFFPLSLWMSHLSPALRTSKSWHSGGDKQARQRQTATRPVVIVIDWVRSPPQSRWHLCQGQWQSPQLLSTTLSVTRQLNHRLPSAAADWLQSCGTTSLRPLLQVQHVALTMKPRWCYNN